MKEVSSLVDYSPPKEDRIWVIWESSYNIPKAIIYLLNGDYTLVMVMLQSPADQEHDRHHAKGRINNIESEQGKI